jgi:hypothetical protein
MRKHAGVYFLLSLTLHSVDIIKDVHRKGRATMSETQSEFLPAISRLVADIERRDAETWELKRTVNKLCLFANMPLRYPDSGPDGGGSRGPLKADQFYGKPLATAVREYMEMRGAPSSGGQGAATVKDIFASLKQGGFAFDTKNDENAMRGLRISLAKNTTTFHKLPNGQFGLLSWYPNAKAVKPEKVEEAEEEEIEEAAEADPEEEEIVEEETAASDQPIKRRRI